MESLTFMTVSRASDAEDVAFFRKSKSSSFIGTSGSKSAACTGNSSGLESRVSYGNIVHGTSGETRILMEMDLPQKNGPVT